MRCGGLGEGAGAGIAELFAHMASASNLGRVTHRLALTALRQARPAAERILDVGWMELGFWLSLEVKSDFSP